MRAFLVHVLLAFQLALVSATQGRTQPVCQPEIALAEAHYSPMKLPKLERTWMAAFTVDASRCATSSGSFSLLFTVWRENAPDIEYTETFQWAPDVNVIFKEFWADEAIGTYRVDTVAPCPCAASAK